VNPYISKDLEPAFDPRKFDKSGSNIEDDMIKPLSISDKHKNRAPDSYDITFTGFKTQIMGERRAQGDEGARDIETKYAHRYLPSANILLIDLQGTPKLARRKDRNKIRAYGKRRGFYST